MSELMIVAIGSDQYGVLAPWQTVLLRRYVPIVIKPPPPIPVNARMRFKNITSFATAHPRHPRRKEIVEVKKQVRRPKISEKRPYKGWKAVLVIKYEVVSQEEVFAALNSELIRAYVEAVIVPSKPERKTFAKIAVVLLDLSNMGRVVVNAPTSIQMKPTGGFHKSGSEANSGCSCSCSWSLPSRSGCAS